MNKRVRISEIVLGGEKVFQGVRVFTGELRQSRPEAPNLIVVAVDGVISVVGPDRSYDPPTLMEFNPSAPTFQRIEYDPEGLPPALHEQ